MSESEDSNRSGIGQPNEVVPTAAETCKCTIVALCLLTVLFSTLVVGSLLLYRILASETCEYPEACGLSDTQFCRTEDCQRVAWMYTASVSRDQDPCQNFYRYVCHGYKDSVAGEMEQNLSNNILRAFLMIHPPPSKQSAPQKAAAFYKLCLGVVRTAKDDNAHVLAAFFQKHKLSFREDTNTDPMNTVIWLVMRYNIQVFYSFTTKKLQLRENTYLFTMGESDLFESWRKRRKPYLADPQRYAEYVASVIENVGITGRSQVRGSVTKIRAVEDSVMGIRNSNHDTDDVTIVPLSTFQQDPQLLSRWVASLRKHSDGVLPRNYSVTLKRTLFAFLTTVFKLVDARDLNIYVAWEAARQLSVFSGMIPDPDVIFNRGYCYTKTQQLFKHAVVSPYLLSAIDRTKLEDISVMIMSIWDRIAEHMEETAWLDNATRTALVRKLRKLRFMVGFPVGMNTAQGVEDFYSSFPDVKGPYLKALLEVSRAYSTDLLNHIYVFPGDLIVADTNYDSVGAYYLPSNVVYVQAGLLLPPMYSVGAPPEVNYGGLGHAVAHEVMHAFDEDSRKVDEAGAAIAWSTDSDEGYKERIQCLKEKIAKTPAKARNLEDEYEADALALRSLYEAYRMAAEDATVKIRGLENFSRDQLFFIGRCFLYCTNHMRPSGTHPLHPHRCNVPLANLPEFATAFSCPPGSPMNPNETCEFW